jgi:hypothetical protein
LTVGPPLCPHDCSYYNAVHGCSYSNLHCLRDGQLYGKALGTGFVGMYSSSQCLGRAGQWICWPQEGTKNKETVKTKVELLICHRRIMQTMCSRGFHFPLPLPEKNYNSHSLNHPWI